MNLIWSLMRTNTQLGCQLVQWVQPTITLHVQVRPFWVAGCGPYGSGVCCNVTAHWTHVAVTYDLSHHWRSEKQKMVKMTTNYWWYLYFSSTCAFVTHFTFFCYICVFNVCWWDLNLKTYWDYMKSNELICFGNIRKISSFCFCAFCRPRPSSEKSCSLCDNNQVSYTGAFKFDL